MRCDELTEAERRELLAVERFWSILERNPRRGTALDRVYGYYVDTGQIDQLIEKSTNLTIESPENGNVWLLQGLILARRNDDLSAIDALQKAESLDASNAMSSFYLGELLIAQGRLRDAAEALERALERKPAKNDALAILQTLGRVYERFNDTENSTRIWEKMEEMFPNDLDILVRIAETLEEEGKFSEALVRYEKLAGLAKNQNYARVRFTLAAADIKIRLGHKQEAIEDFEKLLDELAGDSWLADSVRDRIERVFVRQADYAGLASYYQKQLAKRPNDVNTVHRLAVALVRLSRTGEARELLQKTLERAPSNVKLRLALIDLLVNDRDFDEVDRQYAIIDEQDPNNPDHIRQWGLAVLENRQLDDETRRDRAADLWLRLVKARPNDTATLIMVADLMASKKLNADAEILYLRAVELAPNDPTYREYLGFFYHRSEQHAKAVATFKMMAEGERRTAANLSLLSNILHNLGYKNDAFDAAKEAAKLAPHHFAMQLRYCELLGETQSLDLAKDQLAVVRELVETDDELEQYVRHEIELLGKRGELAAAIDTLVQQPDKSARDWWHLATWLQAAGRIDEATDAIDEAVTDEGRGDKSGVLLVLKTAANIYARGYEQQKAAAIYEKLAELDASMRVEHLKKLAYLQRDLGQTDKAIETARLVMATGAGNAANSRFFADMLIAIGRRADGIEALRRAVRLDPSDTVTLSALAEQLSQAGQIDEAIELVWRIYDRSDDLRGKMSVITKLSTYYQMSQQFGQLVERLRQGMTDPTGRREAAYCLAEAYISVGDYFAARNSLEILLTGVDDEKTGDTFLLEQLSRVAERQGDFDAAIRYQEMLCDLSSLAQDHDRLLGMYYATGQRDKATAIYSQNVFEQGELSDQINAIDRMLAQEDYRPTLTLIERLEAKHPDHWELMYRKLQALYRLKDDDSLIEDAMTVAQAIIALDVADDSDENSHHSPLAISHYSSPYRGYGGYGGGYGGWSFRTPDGDTFSGHGIIFGGTYSEFSPEKWSISHLILLQTLFRELLVYDDRYSSGSGSQDKPLYKPDTVGDAKFAAMMWQLKMSDEDTRNSLLATHSPKTLEEQLRLEVFLGYWASLHRQLDMDTPFAEYSTPKKTAEVKALATRLAFMTEDIAWKRQLFSMVLDDVVRELTVEYYETLDVAEHLAKLPLKAETLEETLLEMQESIADLMEENRSQIAEESQLPNPVTLEQKLDWLVSVFVRACHDNPEEFSGITDYKKLLDIHRYKNRDSDMDKVRASLENAGNVAPGVFYSAMIYSVDLPGFYSWDPCLDMVDETTVSFAEAVPLVLEQHINWIRKGKDAAIHNLMTYPDTGLSLMPASMLSPSLPSMTSMRTGWYYGFSRYGHGYYGGGYGSSPGSGLYGGGYYSSSDGVFSALADIMSEKPGNLWNDELLYEVRDIVENVGTNAMDIVTKGLSARSRRGTSVAPDEDSPVRDLYQLLHPVDEEEWEELEAALTMTRDKLADIAAFREILMRLVELRFEFVRDFGAVLDATGLEPAMQSPQLAQMQAMRQRTSILSNLSHYFDRNAAMDRDDVDMILMHYAHLSPLGGHGVTALPSGGTALPLATDEGCRTDTFLLECLQHAVTFDVLLSISRPGEGVEPEELEPCFRKLLDEYIAEKAASDNVWEARIAKGYTQTCEMLLAQFAAGYDVDDTKDIYEQLQAELKLAKENGQLLPEERLFVLAALAFEKRNFATAVECLDAMTLTAATDIKKRENIILTMHQQAVSNRMLRERAEEAVDRLLGYQLTTEELVTIRGLLRRFDRAEEADRIRDRLFATATDARTQYALLQELQRGGEKTREQAIQYALKVFRSPSLSSLQAMQSDSFNRDLKTLVLDVLKKYGKLEEIIEQIEAQWQASPGSVDIMISLADIYSRNNRLDDAQRVTEEIGKQVPDDAKKMLEHANLLEQVGMKDAAIDWTCKALTKDMELLSQNFREYERTFRNAKQTHRFIALVRDMDASQIENKLYYICDFLPGWLKNETTCDAAAELLESLCNIENATDKSRKNVRAEIIDEMTEGFKEYYPYLKETFLEQATVSTVKDKTADFYRTLGLESGVVFNSWYKFYSTRADAFIASAHAAGQWEALRDELHQITAEHRTLDDDQKDWQRFANALFLEAYLAVHENDAEHACELLTEITDIYPEGDMRKYTNYFPRVTYFLAMKALNSELAPSLTEMLTEYLDTINNATPSDEWWGTGLHDKKMLAKLYFKLGQPERGKSVVITVLRQCLRAINRLHGDYRTEINGTSYWPSTISELIREYADMMKQEGLTFELWLVYQQECAGQDWYIDVTAQQDSHTTVIEVFEGIEDCITPEQVAANIEMLIGIDANNPLFGGHGVTALPSVNLAVQCKTVNATMQGAIRNVFRMFAEAAIQSDGKPLASPLISSKLLDGLRVIAKQDRAKLDHIAETLDRLVAENPAEASLLIAQAFCALAAEDQTDVQNQLVRVADWVTQHAGDDVTTLDWSTWLAVWLIVRETYSDETQYNREQLAEPCETLLRWIDLAKSVGYNDDGTLSSSEPQHIPNQAVNALNFEMERIIP